MANEIQKKVSIAELELEIKELKKKNDDYAAVFAMLMDRYKKRGQTIVYYQRILGLQNIVRRRPSSN